MSNGKNGIFPNKMNILKPPKGFMVVMHLHHDSRVHNNTRDSWQLCIYITMHRFGSIGAKFFVLVKCAHPLVTCSHTI